jgi:hypothetical protein
MKGLQENQISLAWNIAAFQRQKKLKKVEQYFTKDKPEAPKDLPDKMRKMFAAHNKQVK